MEQTTEVYISAEQIKKSAQRAGFSFCGIAPAVEVDADEQLRFTEWLRQGMQADMRYMENYMEQRFHPDKLVEGCRSIVSVALNYYPPERIPETEYQLAWYAYGMDYHLLMKEKMREMLQDLSPLLGERTAEVCMFCDTAPVLERYWAWKAGLGWQGKNGQLIIPGAGSTFFLGELFLPCVTEYDTPMEGRCGNCTRCVDACPAHAIMSNRMVDARRCLSCQTIEHRGPLTEQTKQALGNRIYGCDECQKACPHLRFASPTPDERFHARTEMLRMRKEDWENLTQESYRELFRKSAVKRAKYDGLMRNIEAVAPEK